MSKFQGDVRPLSNDPRYMGVVFQGSMRAAIRQARRAPDHGLAEQHVPTGTSRNRAALLQHLNLLKLPHIEAPSKYSLSYAVAQGWFGPHPRTPV